jgi:hypothetical protein
VNPFPDTREKRVKYNSMFVSIFKSLWPARVILAILIIVEVLAATGVLPLQTEFTWKGLLLQSIIVLLFTEAINKYVERKKLDIAIGPGALLFALQITADATGDLGHLYSRFVWFDQLLHFTGGFVITFMTTGIYRALFERQKVVPLPRTEIVLSGLGVGMICATLYEIEEYLEDLLTGSHRLGNGFDTADDLASDLLGGLLAAVLVIGLPKLTTRRYTRSMPAVVSGQERKM